MNTADERLDSALAAMRDELNGQSASDALSQALRQAVSAKASAAPWRWLISSAAAVAVLAVAASWLQVLPGRSVTEVRSESRMQPERFMVRRQQVPVRVVSPYTGASFRLVDASIVTDQRGLARAVYLHASSPTQEIQ